MTTKFILAMTLTLTTASCAIFPSRESDQQLIPAGRDIIKINLSKFSILKNSESGEVIAQDSEKGLVEKIDFAGIAKKLNLEISESDQCYKFKVSIIAHSTRYYGVNDFFKSIPDAIWRTASIFSLGIIPYYYEVFFRVETEVRNSKTGKTAIFSEELETKNWTSSVFIFHHHFWSHRDQDNIILEQWISQVLSKSRNAIDANLI